jgi:hypothetical protein
MNYPANTRAQFSTLLELQRNHKGNAQLADGRTVSVHEDVSEDWHYYSKAWHRQHGPKTTVERRYILIESVDGSRETVDVPAFRGNYLLSALAAHLALPKVKMTVGLASVQLYEYAQVELKHRVGDARIYTRTFAGTLLDYVVVAKGKTYHAETVAQAVAGWRNKERQRIEHESELLTYDVARTRYGFCHVGISDFCEVNGLDIEASYTRQQVRDAALNHKATNCAKFASELRTVGINIGCK